MELTQDEIRSIAFTAGWAPLGGFHQSKYKYTDPFGNYEEDLPDYNKDKYILKRDTGVIRHKIKTLNNVEALCHRALTN